MKITKREKKAVDQAVNAITMDCSYSQYLRIEKRAGGVAASQKEIIRASRALMSKKGKSRKHRLTRHEWVRSIIKQHNQAKKVYMDIYYFKKQNRGI
tara:strand:+ start:489 stop:779 length:291 start_codon:yes stop_codon:yes gene_type:complete